MCGPRPAAWHRCLSARRRRLQSTSLAASAASTSSPMTAARRSVGGESCPFGFYEKRDRAVAPRLWSSVPGEDHRSEGEWRICSANSSPSRACCRTRIVAPEVLLTRAERAPTIDDGSAPMASAGDAVSAERRLLEVAEREGASMSPAQAGCAASVLRIRVVPFTAQTTLRSDRRQASISPGCWRVAAEKPIGACWYAQGGPQVSLCNTSGDLGRHRSAGWHALVMTQ